MNLQIRHTLGTLLFLFGCAGGSGHDDASDGTPQFGAGADTPEQAAAPAAQVASGAADACPGGGAYPAASGLRIREIALYQTVKIPLVQNGAWVTARPSIVVQNKRAQVRVFVDTLSGYRQRPLRGVLTLQNGGTSTPLVSQRTITAASTDQAADSTFTFDVPAAQIGASTQLSVALTEAQCGTAAGAAEAGSRFPASGAQALGATQTGKLKVILVPLQANGRAPTFSEKDVAGIREVLLSVYPVPGVEVTVRSQPLVLAGNISPSSGTGWSQALNVLTRQRAADRVPADTYYYGLMQPAATQQQFCARGCILGMSPQLTRVSATNQVSISAWYPGNTDASLQYAAMVVGHELGHAHGRGHAPCPTQGGPSGIDRAFPGAAAAVGSWGWNSRTNALIPPTSKDIMGYCQPFWISPYTYQALAVRSQAVNTDKSLFYIPAPGARRWHTMAAYADGTNQWVGVMDHGAPGGDEEPAQVLDASGKVLENIEVARIPLSHTTDEYVQIPEPGASWSKIVMRDREIDLTKVAAPN
ncbi:MAG: hypothetical protein ABW252_14600 [Polyangiales bacterium]